MPKMIVTAIVAASTLFATANAAVITRSYTTVSTFASGPNSTISQSYTLSFDPTVSDSAFLDNYSASPSINPFNKPSIVTDSSADSGIYKIFIGTAAYPTSIGPGDEGYFLFLNLNFDGTVAKDQFGQLSYSFAGGDLYISSSSLTTMIPPPTSSVPEPASWATFIGGFGLIGSAMWRRNVADNFAFA